MYGIKIVSVTKGTKKYAMTMDTKSEQCSVIYHINTLLSILEGLCVKVKLIRYDMLVGSERLHETGWRGHIC